MALQRPVILMRPGEANNRLAGVLLKEGIECWRWPAFRIELPGKEDCDLVQERLDNLDDVEMVILPSPASVAAAAHWVKAWPEHITLATVGEGTEWLPEQLRSIGSDVITMCIYVRVPLELTPEQRSDILMAAHGPSPIIYITSTDAVDALFHAIRPVSEVRDWVTNGVAVTLHPRIVRRLQEAGFHHIEVTCTDDEVVASHIRANLPDGRFCISRLKF